MAMLLHREYDIVSASSAVINILSTFLNIRTGLMASISGIAPS